MQVDHVRNDFVHIPSSTSVQEGGSFSVAEGVDFGSPALSMMRGRHPAHRSSFSREFSIVPGRKSADFIESAGEPKKWFSRTFDDAGPPPGTPVFFFQGILGRSRPEIGRLHRKCGRTEKVTHPERLILTHLGL